jgi:hypothetical protein
MRITSALLPILLTALAGIPLAAQNVRFGVQGALALPVGDLGDSANLGLQLGGHARWDFGQGHGLLGRADLNLYGSRNNFSSSSLGLGADYTYHLERTLHGLYFLAGLSLQDYHMDHSDHSFNDSGLGIDLGAGYELNRNLGLQVRYTSHSFNHSTLSALNLGVTYTF